MTLSDICTRDGHVMSDTSVLNSGQFILSFLAGHVNVVCQIYTFLMFIENQKKKINENALKTQPIPKLHVISRFAE